MSRSSSRFDGVTSYAAPEFAVRLAERRVGGMVAAWSWHQEYAGAMHGAPPRPTLLDIVVSAYMQGVNDVIDTATQRDLFTDRDAATEARAFLAAQW